MKHGIQTCSDPSDPTKLYFRNLYCTFFWGPFDGEAAVISAIQKLDAIDPMWDYDPFCVIHGANPLPDDYVFGFKRVDDEVIGRIHAARKHP